MALTAAQIIGIGEYLESDFDPSTLTVAQLLGVFGFHNIIYPSPYTKGKLVQLFNEQIKPKASKFKKERLKKENSIASDDGITDGVTGKPIGKAPARRSSRRLSRAPAETVDQTAARPDPPKRRRSTAQPTFGGPSRSNTRAQPAILIEESEPEEEERELPVRKVGRSKKTSEAAGSQARRVSQPDSGWEDNNIFQSGAESSSPLRPSPVRKPARKSIGARKSRKSTSAPPQLLPNSSPLRPSPDKKPVISPRFPPQSEFKPELSPAVARESHRLSPRPKIPKPEFNASSGEEEPNIHDHDTSRTEYMDYIVPIHEESEQEYDDQQSEPDQSNEDQTLAVSQRIAEGGRQVARRTQRSNLPSLWAVAWLILSVLIVWQVQTYKAESSSIGYCDAGSNTNQVLEDLRARRTAVEVCNHENRTTLYLPSPQSSNPEPCPLPELRPFVPDSCTPCPEHATCTQRGVSCVDGFLLRSHKALFLLPPSPAASEISLTLGSSPFDVLWKGISIATDGLPGLGSIGLPPRCVEDPKRKRNISVLGKALDVKLAQTRGQRICDSSDIAALDNADGGEARMYGWEYNELQAAMQKRNAPPSYNATFKEATQQLFFLGSIIMSEDRNGNRYVAHTASHYTLQCALKIKARQAWVAWRRLVFAALAILVASFRLKAHFHQKAADKKRVAELVQIALATLQTQEMAHHTDPVTAPQPYLSSLQLRDLILQEEHSIPTRSRLWDKVEQIVEGNANVRANVQEVHGGDELRVWRWVGSAGTPVVNKKRGQLFAAAIDEEAEED